jgi:hypothetical protein
MVMNANIAMIVPPPRVKKFIVGLRCDGDCNTSGLQNTRRAQSVVVASIVVVVSKQLTTARIAHERLVPTENDETG